MARRVVITGAGGYVGSAIAHRFLASGYEVVGYGHGGNFPLLHAYFGSRGALVPGDMVDEKTLFASMRGADIVIHTASPTKETFCIERPWEALRSIVYGTRAVARAVRKLEIPLLIHFSTQAVYMNYRARSLPLTEEMEPQPDTVYGALKLAAEYELRDTPAYILRPANIFGRNPLGIERDNVITRFIRAARAGSPLTLTGDGSQRADYVHLNDVVSAVLRLSLVPQKESTPVVYNVGSGVARSVAEIARFVLAEAEKNGLRPPPVIFSNTNANTAADRVLSPGRIQVALPGFPFVSFEEGIRELFH